MIITLWRPLVQYEPISQQYAQLAMEPLCEAWLLIWLPGQGTDWHDHGGSAGAFTVVRGSLTEESASTRRDGEIGVHPGSRRLDTGALRPFSSRHTHRVTNTDVVPAVSPYVCAPALLEMNYEARARSWSWCPLNWRG